MIRLLPLLLVIGLLIWGVAALRRQPPARRRALARQFLLWGVFALLLLAVLTGRLNPLFAALGAALPVLLRFLGVVNAVPGLRRWLVERGLGRLFGGAAAGEGRLRTRFLELRIDPLNGRLDGMVQAGPFAGERLAALDLDQLLRMLEFYHEADPRSASLLDAYLVRERGYAGQHRAGADATGQQQPHSGGAALDEPEARAILGVADDADAAAIRAAHRRLMQRLHPDRGGSDYLAAQINRAKARLLGD